MFLNFRTPSVRRAVVAACLKAGHRTPPAFGAGTEPALHAPAPRLSRRQEPI
ncbi:hypothetical protein HMPREF9946_00786 [Acetobacteraceae bacterium AT-5844]|nr:hypothetical protein HMPREF9946_00786 [Acetobacteraceae bacterium AT-5844]